MTGKSSISPSNLTNVFAVCMALILFLPVASGYASQTSVRELDIEIVSGNAASGGWLSLRASGEVVKTNFQAKGKRLFGYSAALCAGDSQYVLSFAYAKSVTPTQVSFHLPIPASLSPGPYRVDIMGASLRFQVNAAKTPITSGTGGMPPSSPSASSATSLAAVQPATQSAAPSSAADSPADYTLSASPFGGTKVASSEELALPRTSIAPPDTLLTGIIAPTPVSAASGGQFDSQVSPATPASVIQTSPVGTQPQIVKPPSYSNLQVSPSETHAPATLTATISRTSEATSLGSAVDDELKILKENSKITGYGTSNFSIGNWSMSQDQKSASAIITMTAFVSPDLYGIKVFDLTAPIRVLPPPVTNTSNVSSTSTAPATSTTTSPPTPPTPVDTPAPNPTASTPSASPAITNPAPPSTPASSAASETTTTTTSTASTSTAQTATTPATSSSDTSASTTKSSASAAVTTPSIPLKVLSSFLTLSTSNKTSATLGGLTIALEGSIKSGDVLSLTFIDDPDKPWSLTVGGNFSYDWAVDLFPFSFSTTGSVALSSTGATITFSKWTINYSDVESMASATLPLTIKAGQESVDYEITITPDEQ